MMIFRGAVEAGRCLPAPVVLLGKFETIHRGHEKAIRTGVARARSLMTSCVVIMFDPSADQYLKMFSRSPIEPLAKRIERLDALGVDGLLLLPFDRELACLSAEAFTRDILAGRLRPVEVCVGSDFCFGKDREGTGALKRLGAELGFLVRIVPIVKEGGRKITSERVRDALRRGSRAEAEKLAGRPLAL